MFNVGRMSNFVIEVYERAFDAHPFAIEVFNLDLQCFTYVVGLVERHSSVEDDVDFCEYTGADLRIRNIRLESFKQTNEKGEI